MPRLDPSEFVTRVELGRATKLPPVDPSSVSISCSPAQRRNASLTVVRPTPNLSASCFSGGSRSPLRSSPLSIDRRIAAAMSS
jgi:hypothetical protein